MLHGDKMDPLEKILATYGTDINEASNTYGIAPELLASLIYQESRGNPKAVSPVGAMGLTQMMPDTARYLGVKDPFNPKEAIHGGAKYLREQYDKFGNVESALAAYNAGPGNVQKYGGIPPFKETQKYVPSILGRVQNRSIGTNTAPKSFSSYDDASSALDQIMGGGASNTPQQASAQPPSYKSSFNSYDDASSVLDQLVGPMEQPQGVTAPEAPAVSASSEGSGAYKGNLNKALSFAEGAYRGTGGAVRDKLLGALGLQNPEDYAAASLVGTTPKTAANVRKTMSKYAAMQEPGANLAGELAPMLFGGGVGGTIGKGVGGALKAPKLVKTAADLGTQSLTMAYMLDPEKDVKTLAKDTAVGLVGGAALGGIAKGVGLTAKTVGSELLAFQNNISKKGANYAIDNLTTSFTKKGLLNKAEASIIKNESEVHQFLANNPTMVDVGDVIDPRLMDRLVKSYQKVGDDTGELLDSFRWAINQNKGKLNIADANKLKQLLWAESKFTQTGNASSAKLAQSAYKTGQKVRQRLNDAISKSMSPEDAARFTKMNSDWGASIELSKGLRKDSSSNNLIRLLNFITKPIGYATGSTGGAMSLGKTGNVLQNSADSAILQALGIKTGQGVFNATNK